MPNLYKHQVYSLCVLKDFGMVEFGFLPPNFGNLVGTHECHLPFSECRWSMVLLRSDEDTLTNYCMSYQDTYFPGLENNTKITFGNTS